jgi:hypothetical protein
MVSVEAQAIRQVSDPVQRNQAPSKKAGMKSKLGGVLGGGGATASSAGEGKAGKIAKVWSFPWRLSQCYTD